MRLLKTTLRIHQRFLILLMVMMLLVITQSCSREVKDVRERTFGGDKIDWINDLIPDKEDGYWAVGFTASAYPEKNEGGWDLLLAHLNKGLEVEFARSWGSSGRDAALKIVEREQGGYFIAGYSGAADGDTPENHGKQDIWVLRLNDAAEIIWSKHWGGQWEDEAFGLLATEEGGCVVAGYTTGQDSSGKPDPDMWAMSLGPEGKEIWKKTYPRPGRDMGTFLLESPAGGYLTGGMSTGEKLDARLLRLDAKGDTIWTRTFGGEGDDVLVSACTMPDSGWMLAGFSESQTGGFSGNQGQKDGWVLRIDKNGSEIWSELIGEEGEEVFNSIRAAKDTSMYWLSGYSNSNYDGSPDNQALFTTMDKFGKQSWQNQFGDDGDDRILTILPLGNQEALLGGIFGKNDESGDPGDAWLYKIKVK